MSKDWKSQIVASPASHTAWTQAQIMNNYLPLGVHCCELYPFWTAAAPDPNANPSVYTSAASERDFRFPIFHLPGVDQQLNKSLSPNAAGIRYGKRLGVDYAMLRGINREIVQYAYAQLKPVAEQEGVKLAIKNHSESNLEGLNHFRILLDEINDPDLKIAIDLGQYYLAAVDARQVVEFFKNRIDIVYLSDKRGAATVPLGLGDIDLKAVFRHLGQINFSGYFVLMMDVRPVERAMEAVKLSLQYLEKELIPLMVQ